MSFVFIFALEEPISASLLFLVRSNLIFCSIEVGSIIFLILKILSSKIASLLMMIFLVKE